MDRTVTITPETAKRALSAARGIQGEVDAITASDEADQRPYAVSMLELIGTLRRDLARTESELEDAKETLQDTEEWDHLQGLKEERKALQKKLDRALDRTIHWAQPTMI